MEQVSNDRKNNFGVLRLLFAALVVVSHSSELIDGDRSREILTRIFGTMSFGELAVDGFFLVSGYLITKSFAERPDVRSFLVKRVLRIVPAYFVSFWLCVLVLAPFVGADRPIVSFQAITGDLLLNLQLQPPIVAGAFHGLSYPFLNGAMWTLAYEFRCYLAVLLLGVVGGRLRLSATRSRWTLLFFVTAGLTANAAHLFGETGGFHASAIGVSGLDCRFFSVFGVGASFYLFRDRIALTNRGAVAAAILLPIMLFERHTAEAGVALFGGYLVFWFAFKFKLLGLSLANSKNDISYGLYLYAWPIQSFIIWNDRTISPWLLCPLALLGAGLAGYASWHLVEKRAQALARQRVFSRGKRDETDTPAQLPLLQHAQSAAPTPES